MEENNNKTEVQEHHNELEKTHHSSRRLGTVTILLIFGLFGIWSVLPILQRPFLQMAR